MNLNGTLEKHFVLVVDDQPENLEVLTDLLHKAQYKVLVAKNGIRALEIAAHAHPLLILLDIVMPGMDGYTVCSELKKNAALKEIPIIFISGNNNEIDIVKAFEAGGVDYITKPFQVKEVLARVNVHASLRLAQFQLEEQNVQLAQLSKAKSEFLANMSHEIRTPLTGVLGMVSLINDTPLNSQQKQYIDTINAAGNVLLQVINDILDFSKIEAGKLSIEHIPFDIFHLIEDSVGIISQKAHDAGVPLIVEVCADCPRQGIGDPTRIRQILLNYLSNAFKFTKQGSVKVRVTYESQHLHIEVIDTGIGLTSAQQESMFQAFSQAEASTSRKYGGTGLGLTICKKLSELMGGTVDVRSEVGKGSCFWLNLPIPVATEALLPLSSPLRYGVLLSAQPEVVDKIVAPLAHRGIKLLCFANIDDFYNQHSAGTLSSCQFVLYDCLEYLQHLPQLSNTLQERCTGLQQVMLVDPFSRLDMAHINTHALIHQIEYPATPLRIEQMLNRLSGVEFSSGNDNQSANKGYRFQQCAILVAEDNKVNQIVIRGMLEKVGVVPHFAHNGVEALELIFEKQLDVQLVLMDCEMPEMDGFEATRIIRQRQLERKQHLPIIGLSAHALMEHKQRALEAGMDRYLTKPINFQKLCETIAEVL